MLLDVRVPPRFEVRRSRARRAALPRPPTPTVRNPLPIDRPRLWKAEAIAEVMDMVKAGITRAEIAKAFGVTRNSICGLVHKEQARRRMAK